ncbi:hypothetical protein RHMOL_Rhmol01G0114000 [Rhododendron molle]|uniref:Uncharacterized protein n=1 Tax=Rhododendron molle TaxID=49168 RepID=A0ACC0Q260_RHOML|nr:hypothetical protein RHMOL_Rhmol01G0114000 [Rhododendron molle]
MASSIALRRAVAAAVGRIPLKFTSAVFAPSAYTRSFATDNRTSSPTDDDDDDVPKYPGTDLPLMPTLSVKLLSLLAKTRSRLNPTSSSTAADDDDDDANNIPVVIQVDQKYKTLFKVENPFQTDGPLKQVETDQVRDGTLVRMTMPGVGPDGMKVWVVDNTVFFSGEGEIELAGEDSGRSYGGSIEFDPKFNRAAGVKADIANGVLKLLVPYAKGGEKKKDGYERVVNL